MSPRHRKDPGAPLISEGYTWAELHRLVATTLKAGISVLVRGHPGVGKSTLAQVLAVDFDLPLIDIRLAQRDPVDLAGVWFPDRETRSLKAFPPEWALRAAKEPCFIFLDEINSAVTKLHQAAAYQIVLEKRVGEVDFHSDTVVMAAGNLEEDNAIVSSLSSALCNRFAHFIMRVDAETWLDWGESVGLEPSILGYIGARREDVLYDREDQDLAFPSPRSWAMASRILAQAEEQDRKRLVAACVGAQHATEFCTWQTLYSKVNPESILKHGRFPDFTNAKLREPSFVYAAIYAVAGWLRDGGQLSDRQLPNIVTFLRRPGVDPEYVFLFLRHIHPQKDLWFRLRGLAAFRELAAELVGLRTQSFL